MISRIPPTLLLSFALATVPGLLAAQTPGDTGSGRPRGDAVPHAEKPSKPSTSLQVNVPGHPGITLSLADLNALPQVTVEVLNAHTKTNETFSGPLVSDVLAKGGVTLSEATQHGVLDSYVMGTGTDGYFVIYSGAELQPGLHKAQTIVATAEAGKPLGRTGAFQLVDAGDVKPARWVRNLQAITVVSVQVTAKQ